MDPPFFGGLVCWGRVIREKPVRWASYGGELWFMRTWACIWEASEM